MINSKEPNSELVEYYLHHIALYFRLQYSYQHSLWINSNIRQLGFAMQP